MESPVFYTISSLEILNLSLKHSTWPIGGPRCARAGETLRLHLAQQEAPTPVSDLNGAILPMPQILTDPFGYL